MTERCTRRSLTKLATASLMAGAMTALPVTVKVNLDSPLHPELGAGSESGSGLAIKDDRLAALARLGLGKAFRYSSPLVLTLSQAAARSGGGSGGGGGGGGDGDSGGGGGGSGGGGGDSGGGGGGSGGNSGPGGSGGSESGNSGPGGSSGSSSGSSSEGGAASGAASGGASGGGDRDGFGGVEQAGPDLSKGEEAAAISSGWE